MTEVSVVIKSAEPSDGSSDQNRIAELQALAIRCTRAWSSDSFCRGNENNGNRIGTLDCCSAFIEAARAFPWNDPAAIEQGLFGELVEAVSNLGDSYMMLSGRRQL